jgi:hypothetical protein
MRVGIFVLLGLALGACSRDDEAHARAQAERAKEQARQTAQKVKEESREAFHKAGEEAHKASAELNHDLEKAREKTRRALSDKNRDEPENPK